MSEQPRSHHIQIPRTARYYTLGEIDESVKYCWIVCHGYGQLAEKFIENFQVLARPDQLILAPEGLSRFYWNSFDGPVVASWMTREDRLHEIADYAGYLQTLYELTIPKLHPEVKIVLLGFSQGVATQIRWVMRKFPFFQHLILWAGTIPEDINYQPHRPFLLNKHLYYVYGTQDPFLTPERIREQQRLIDDNEWKLEMYTFSGKHHLDPALLQQLDRHIRGE